MFIKEKKVDIELCSRENNLPSNVAAGGHPLVEHSEAGIVDEIGETHGCKSFLSFCLPE